MTTETIKIENKEYNIFTIEYKGETLKVGDCALGDKILDIIERDLFLCPMVTTADNSVVSPEYIDDTIYCFLGEQMENPTQEDIIENIISILEESDEFN